MRRAFACLCAALLLSACSGEDDPSSRPSSSPLRTEAAVVATEKPKVAKPTGAPPTDLVQEDITKGTGAAVVPGHVVTVHYVGVKFSDGTEFDTSWGSNPLSFTLGDHEVIEGWDKGLLGMRVGGRRRLVIPPKLAYGEGPPFPGNELAGETLVFVVDVISTGGAPANLGG